MVTAPSSQDLKSIEYFFLAEFYSFRPSPHDYEVTISNGVSPSPTVRPTGQAFGPITRGEHDLQLWLSGRHPEERQRTERPQNLLGKSFEEYKQLYFLPEHVRTNGDQFEGQHRNQHDQHRLEEGEDQTGVEWQPDQQGIEEDDANAVLQLGPRNDVIEGRQGILGTGRILRATALAVSSATYCL